MAAGTSICATGDFCGRIAAVFCILRVKFAGSNIAVIIIKISSCRLPVQEGWKKQATSFYDNSPHRT